MRDGDGEPPVLVVTLGHDLSGSDELEVGLPGVRQDDRVALVLLALIDNDLPDVPVDPVLLGLRVGPLDRSGVPADGRDRLELRPVAQNNLEAEGRLPDHVAADGVRP